MIRHDYLYDPVERTADMNITEFTKYTEIANAQVGPTDDSIVAEIKDRYFKFIERQSCTNSERKHASSVWGIVASKIKSNAGLARFTLDYNGTESLCFFPWLINVSRSPSKALEMAYGAGEDIFGDWCDEITDDPIVFFVKNDPTFVYNRERQLYVADLAAAIVGNTPIHGKPGKIVDFGAGRLAWARWHGFEPDSKFVNIYAYDRDSTIALEDLFHTSPERLGIKFKHGDLMEHVNSPEATHADLIILGGVASYIPKEIFSQAVVMPIYHLLNTGGTFFFDLQMDCPYLRRSMSIFDWPKMYLDGRDSAAKVIAEVEEMRKAFWHKGLKFSAEYTLDTYNESPSAVMVTMQKL